MPQAELFAEAAISPAHLVPCLPTIRTLIMLQPYRETQFLKVQSSITKHS